MIDGTAGNYEEGVMTQTDVTKNFILSLSQEQAKELISGYGAWHEEFYNVTPRLVGHTARYDTEQKMESQELLGDLNYQYKCLYGEWAF